MFCKNIINDIKFPSVCKVIGSEDHMIADLLRDVCIRTDNDPLRASAESFPEAFMGLRPACSVRKRTESAEQTVCIQFKNDSAAFSSLKNDLAGFVTV